MRGNARLLDRQARLEAVRPATPLSVAARVAVMARLRRNRGRAREFIPAGPVGEPFG